MSQFKSIDEFIESKIMSRYGTKQKLLGLDENVSHRDVADISVIVTMMPTQTEDMFYEVHTCRFTSHSVQ